MLNKIWPAIIIISVVFSILLGKTSEINDSIFKSSEKAIELTITFIGTICLWNGIINIAYKTTLIKKIVKLINPIINKIFPEVINDKEIKDNIGMNIVSNIFGLGNAATPSGIKAMKLLQEKNNNKNIISDSMIMLIILNTASLQIIPTSIIAIRNSLNSKCTTNIVFPIWIATFMAASTAIIGSKILIELRKKNDIS